MVSISMFIAPFMLCRLWIPNLGNSIFSSSKSNPLWAIANIASPLPFLPFATIWELESYCLSVSLTISQSLHMVFVGCAQNLRFKASGTGGDIAFGKSGITYLKPLDPRKEVLIEKFIHSLCDWVWEEVL